jgi:hypothetical protein
MVSGLLVTSVVRADDGHDKGKTPFAQIVNTLNQILTKLNSGGGEEGNYTQRWDTNNPSDTRFTTAFPGAVLDKNTGLVWEQAPDTNTYTWNGARIMCLNKNVGGTRGWRLPSIVELTSLIDPALPAPFVPTTVFTGVLQLVSGNPLYWSASADAAFVDTNAWLVVFSAGDMSIADKNATIFGAWCVRGGMNAGVY